MRRWKYAFVKIPIEHAWTLLLNMKSQSDKFALHAMSFFGKQKKPQRSLNLLKFLNIKSKDNISTSVNSHFMILIKIDDNLNKKI